MEWWIISYYWATKNIRLLRVTFVSMWLNAPLILTWFQQKKGKLRFIFFTDEPALQQCRWREVKDGPPVTEVPEIGWQIMAGWSHFVSRPIPMQSLHQYWKEPYKSQKSTQLKNTVIRVMSLPNFYSNLAHLVSLFSQIVYRWFC